MEKFIKENWFKLGILFILLLLCLLGIYYFAISSSHNGGVGSKENCSKQANEVFVKNTDEYERTYQNYNYTNHWNEKMGECFVLITGGDLATEYHATLYNAYDNKDLGGIHTAGKIAGLCGLEVGGSYKTCEHFGKEGYVMQAREEFDNLAKVYMEN